MNSMTIIQLVSIILGISTPAIFFLVLRSGINNSPFSDARKRSYTITAGIIIATWSLLIWGLTLRGFFSYTEDDIFPGFLWALLFPVAAILLLFRPTDFNRLTDHIELRVLTAGQFWRLLGAVFFIVALSGLGPMEYISSGIGDVMTGTLAIITFLLIIKKARTSNIFIWAFTLVGMADLVMVLFIMISHYPIWSDAIPSTELAGTYPMMLIVGLAAPVALLLHIILLKKVLKSNVSVIRN